MTEVARAHEPIDDTPIDRAAPEVASPSQVVVRRIAAAGPDVSERQAAPPATLGRDTVRGDLSRRSTPGSTGPGGDADRRSAPGTDAPGRDATLHDLAGAPSTGAAMGQLIAAIRWCAVVLGTALVAADAVDGDVALVVTNAVCLYLTTWRTMRPLPLGDARRSRSTMAVTDAAIIGAAIGLADGVASPFVGCVAVAAAVAAFGWGARTGLVALAAGVVSIVVVAAASSSPIGLDRWSGGAIVVGMAAAVILVSIARGRLVRAEQRRRQLAGRLDALAETNQLLHVLNRVARTLPSSLDLQQAVSAARNQLADAFDATVICLVMRSDVNEASWAPLLAEGMALAPTMTREALPPHLRTCLDADGPILVARLDGTGLATTSGSGVYSPLRTRGRVVGLLGVEHGEPDRYGDRDGRLLAGLGDALALTIDNARWFRRLRILGAEEERARIARDLHDRLGQWLTYISFELERIRNSPTVGETDELDALHGDVQRAIDELRETLRQMRTTVTEDQGLAAVARDLTDRYARQSGLRIDLHVTEDGERLPVAIENEVLRIMQEALTNIGKHAHATAVSVDWIVEPTRARLRVADDGDGFDESRGVRETAFGLVGMRERAEVIDAELVVTSSPGAGTTIELSVPREDSR